MFSCYDTIILLFLQFFIVNMNELLTKLIFDFFHWY